MDGVASIGIVGAVAGSTRTQSAQQTQPVRQEEPAADPGSSALKLIQSLAINLGGTGYDLDVRV
jgi:hypothetical protein